MLAETALEVYLGIGATGSILQTTRASQMCAESANGNERLSMIFNYVTTIQHHIIIHRVIIFAELLHPARTLDEDEGQTHRHYNQSYTALQQR